MVSTAGVAKGEREMTAERQPSARPALEPPVRYESGDWAKRIQVAREARESAKELREGKPVTIPEPRFN